VLIFVFRRYLLAGVCCLLFGSAAFGQSVDSTLAVAHGLLEAKEFDKAVVILKETYKTDPGKAYSEYLNALIGAKDFKAAERLVDNQLAGTHIPTLFIDLGRVFEAQGKQNKAREQYDAAAKAVNGDEMLAQQLVSRFTAAGHEDYAIIVYERMRAIMQNSFLYSGPLSKLYAKIGDVPKAVDALLNGGPTPFGGGDETKAQLLEVLGDDPAKLAVAQKAILRRINLQPDNIYYAELLTWLYTQKGDWDGALMQIQAIDERNNGGGQSLLQFSQLAEKEGQYEIAKKSLDAVIEVGNAKPYYSLARAQKLSLGMRRLKDNPNFTKEEVAVLASEFESFLKEFPQYAASDAARDYAELEAQFNNNPKKGIAILEKAISEPTASKEFTGRAKLQMGDYQILDGKIWEATLTYSQVDKAFREDFLGEDARFRNGRLAYYRGDFNWAQLQLSVLKASTSELIANDALNLSVLITENTPDSNTAALSLFARADLLLFQNRYADALKVLDSISVLYPKHALTDDVLMLRAALAQKRHEYDKALEYLAAVMNDHAKDVLGDDAVFKTAEIYERALNKPDEAKKFYEQLIIDYPGSTYVQIARGKLSAIGGGIL
jgi:predicted Zn-dependent protease